MSQGLVVLSAAATALSALAAEMEELKGALASCVDTIEAIMADAGVVSNEDTVSEALEKAGLIYWSKVPASGEISESFDGMEDLEPGDSYWAASRKWGDILSRSRLHRGGA